MQSASLSICQSALSLSQLRLVPKVGQWSQLSLRVVYYKGIQYEQVKLPQTKDYKYFQKNERCTTITQNTKIQRYKKM